MMKRLARRRRSRRRRRLPAQEGRKQQQAEQELWAEATDDVTRRRRTGPAPSATARGRCLGLGAWLGATRGHGAIGSAPALQAGG